MNLFDFVSKMTAGEVAGWGLIVLILLLSFVQISPLKLNPWDRIFSWIGQKANGKMQSQLQSLALLLQNSNMVRLRLLTHHIRPGRMLICCRTIT